MALVNKNGQKVKLADGLTEIGLSQVKSEIGGGVEPMILIVSGGTISNYTTAEVVEAFNKGIPIFVRGESYEEGSAYFSVISVMSDAHALVHYVGCCWVEVDAETGDSELLNNYYALNDDNE